MTTFKVTLTFDGVTSKNPLAAAKLIAEWAKDGADKMTYDVEDEKNGLKFTVDLAEDDAAAVFLFKKS